MWIFWLLLLAPCSSVFAFGGFGQGCESQLLLGFLLGNSFDGFSGGSLFGSSAHCPSGFMNLNGCSKNDCYFFSTEMLTWEQARIDCINRGAHLVIVKNSKENNAIKAHLQTINPGTDFWNALNDIRNENTLQWDPKTPSQSPSFRDLTAGNGGNAADLDCVVFNGASSFMWTFRNCSDSYRYVCERQANRKFSCNAH